MIDFPHLSRIIRKNDAKVLMLVLSGISGAPDPLFGRSELEAARVPNLDQIARQSSGGLSVPVAPGISPGSAVGNLALLGYDPLTHFFGRGAIEATGAGVDLQSGDVAFRGNLAKFDAQGNVVDRRAGVGSHAQAAELIARLTAITVPGVEVSVTHSIGHRFALRMRGPRMNAAVSDTDPMERGVPASTATPTHPDAILTANAVNAFVKSAAETLAGAELANGVLVRGASETPRFVSFPDTYQVNAAGVAAYPLYRGLAKAIGMQVYPVAPDFVSHLHAVRDHWNEHNFFWVHYREPSATPDKMTFQEKKRAIELLDEHVREFMDLKPDVLVVTGDHANPSGHPGHSWHGVPFVIRSPGTLGDSGVDRFNERDLRSGSLGQFEAKHAMMLVLAHAGKLKEYGA